MSKTTNNFADTTDNDQVSGILDNALRSLSISGNILLREPYALPWSIGIPDTEQLTELLDVSPRVRVVAFHLVEFGHCELKTVDGKGVLLKAGEMVICFGGQAHELMQGDRPQLQSIETLLSGGQNVQHPDVVSQTASASLLCGVFLLHHTAFNPLFSALPPFIHVNLSRPGEMHNLSGVARLMAEEIDRKSLGRGYIIERLLEVLYAEAVRAHIEAIPTHDQSWVRAIKDPIIGRAIAAIHSNPGEPWSVQRLARDVAMSPSRFAARFAETLGDSPMAYVSKWRMNVACRQLSTTQQRVDKIAIDVGYESPAAFSRVFKKRMGVSPAAWRMRERV